MMPVDIAAPLLAHLNFLEYTLTTRSGSNDTAFETRLNQYDFYPAEIFFHGVHALYRSVILIDKPDLEFREIDIPRLDEKSITQELMTLYRNTVTSFVSALKKMSVEDLEEEIPSPLSGKLVKRKDWFAQSVMHTIHHVGQGIRLQGIVDRKLSQNPVDYATASDYTSLFA